jgi:hypothetical protein
MPADAHAGAYVAASFAAQDPRPERYFFQADACAVPFERAVS